MADHLKLFTVWIEEFDTHEIVLPARSPKEATTIAYHLRQAFGTAAFTPVTEFLPDPGKPKKPPQISHPERLITDLARLYRLMSDKRFQFLAADPGPDPRAFAEEFDILEGQIDHLRRAGFGRLNAALHGHDGLVAANRQPRQVLPAAHVTRHPANPPKPAPLLRSLQLTKIRAFARRIAHSVAHPFPADAPPILPGEENFLRIEWRKLQQERAHTLSLAPQRPTPPKQTEQTFFDRLSQRARSGPPPLVAREQDNGRERN